METLKYCHHNILKYYLSVERNRAKKEITLGLYKLYGSMPCKNAVNCIILVVTFFIYKCKMEGRNPDFAGVQSYL